MSQPTESQNPFTPPQAPVESLVTPKRKSGALMPYEKAGRVIRLMALLGVVGLVGIGAAVLMPAMSSGQLPHLLSLLPLALTLALVVGLFFVGSAVMRHESWARVVGIIYAAIALLGFPLGTLIGAYVLWQLVFKWDETELNGRDDG